MNSRRTSEREYDSARGDDVGIVREGEKYKMPVEVEVAVGLVVAKQAVVVDLDPSPSQ